MYFYQSVIFLCLFFIGNIQSSAIPMWELLSKQEKTSYLYSMFANQVEEFCEGSTLPNCNQALLKYGLNKLKSLPEEKLDIMDPYQRGANQIIWDSMMQGHAMQRTTPKPRSTTTAKPNSYEDESFSSDYDFGSQAAASAKIDNVYRVHPPRNFIHKLSSGTPQYAYPNNAHYFQSRPYTKFQKQYTTTATEKIYYQSAPLDGPMVVKVHPDGSPVSEPIKPLPQDEDLRQYQLSKVKIPNF